jgi:RNA-directed DNA polymerase
VVETDIANCFEAIPHEKLMQAVEERVCDRAVLKLLRAILRAGVLIDGQVRRAVTGTAQGGVISPLPPILELPQSRSPKFPRRVDLRWSC